jgi:hypothetical protein
MNVVVDGSPESCLAQVEAFFAHDWPHGGSYRRPTPNTLTLAARAPRHRYMLESRIGVVVWLILTLITVGVFAAIWFFYWMIREAGPSDPEIYKARVVATPESPTQTRVSVSASRGDWRQTLESWVQQELVENSVAKKASRGQLDASDIPGQISRLAELRDGGVITAEEFEEKKRDLLDRM